ncbi:MAG TPA: ribonuclease HII [Actinobacteria bacterium]|nr:ribonuclease HII [Actinomycetota bacterium]HCK79201.1 ribonuclease HII [Actinomycetota bacterium]
MSASLVAELGVQEQLERAGFAPVAGVDEAGRGACAGPLVVAAVVLSEDSDRSVMRDSKALSPKARERAFDHIMATAESVCVIAVEPAEIDRVGIQRADLDGFRRAVSRLATPPAFVLTDGYAVQGLPVPSLAVWKGDQVCPAVAAASIVAKVTRDRTMVELDAHFPGYRLAAHKGYVTAAHRAALARLGASAVHRRSFAPVAEVQR